MLPDEEESELIEMLPFLASAIFGRGEYPRRTGGNEQGLRDPCENYGLPRSIDNGKKLQ